MDLNQLRDTVEYSPETGIFTRKIAAGNKAAGTQIGNVNVKGYLKALVHGKYVVLHRLAWFYVFGVWPTQLDHINGDKQDNRIANLRECDTSTNCLNQRKARINNRLQCQGVHKILKTGRYRASCTVHGKKKHLGVFTTLGEAQQAYQQFKTPYLPEIS